METQLGARLMLEGLLAAEDARLLESQVHRSAAAVACHRQRSLVGDDKISADEAADVGGALPHRPVILISNGLTKVMPLAGKPL